MALLAIIDVDDAATEKIKRTKTALEDLVAVAQKSAQAIARNTSVSGAGNMGKGFADTNQNLTALIALAQQTNAALQAVNASVQALGTTMQRQQQQGQGMQSGLNGIAVQAALLSAALYNLAGNVRGLLEDAARLAARVETLGVVTQLTAKNAGYTTAELTGQAAAIRKLGITTEEATDSVLQFVRSNLNLADAAKLARVAQDLAVVAGKNSSQTYETLTRAIQTSETMLLRQFGIVTTNEQLWAAHARTLNKAVGQLTSVEKQQAFVNRILEEGAKVTGAYESSMETASKKLSSMARLTTELKLKLGNELLPAFTLIVGIIFNLLEVLNKIDPVWFKLFASVAAGVAAMASFASAITAVVGVASAFMAVMGAAAGPVGIIAVAIGLLTAAFVALSSTAEVSVAELGEMAAALDVQTTAIEKANKTYTELTAKNVELGAKTEKQTKDQADLRKSIEDLAQAVPTARVEFDLLTGSYKLNEEEIQRILKLNEELRKSYEAAAGAQLLATQRELSHTAQDKAKAQIDVNRARDNLAQAEKDLADLTKRIEQERAGATTGLQKSALVSRMQSAKDAVRSAEESFISYAAVLTDLDRKERVLNVTIANTERTLAEISKNLPDRIKEIRKGVTADWDKFVARAKELGVNIQSAFDEKNFGDLDKYRTLLVGLQGDIQKAGDKAMRAKQAYDTAFESALKNIRGDTIATKAQLKAVEQGLSEVGKGTEEYRDRVVRASAAIAQWHKASDSVKKSLTELGHAATVLEAIELEKWAEGVNDQFEKLAVSGAEAMNKVSQGLSGEITKMFMEQFDKEFELREAHAEKIYDLDQQIADERAKVMLDQTDLAIYQEQRRVTEIERAIEKEIRARERAQEKAEQLFEDRVRQAQAEVRELERNIRMQMDMREEQMELELKFQYLTLKISEEEANKKIAILRTERDAAAARNAATMEMRLKEISEEAAVGRRRLQQTRELNAQLATEQRAAMGRQLQASADTVQQIKRDAGIIFQLTRGIAESLAQSVSKGFLDILTQARSVKDTFIGIVRSMADTVLSIISDMVTQWVRKAALMATTGGGFNVGTFARALMGGGGMSGTGGIGAANMSVFGNAALQGGAYGMAGTSAGATNALGGTGGAGAMMAGGVAAAGGGYAVGSLMASKFGRESYFHSGGIGAASGAATGAAIGSVVPGIGTGVGAGVGAIAGAIGGWLQERKRRKELMAERDQIVEDMGGLDEFKRKAEEAGVALDKFLDTKKSKVYAAELDKIQKAFLALDIKKFIEAQGGLEAIKEKAKEAGIELTKAFLEGTGEAADMQRELEKVAKALQLQDAKESLARTVTQMDELRKRAVLAGYDLKKLYDAKTIEEFNNEQAKLNKLLEEQQRRLQGLGTAAAGIQQRIVGLQQFIGKGMADVFATMGEEGAKEFAKAFEEAQKSGYGGGPLKFLMENLEEFKSSSAEFTGLFAKVQEGVDRVGVAVAATFGGILRETGDIMAAFNAVSGSLDMLAQIAQETGVEIKGSLKYLLEFRNTVRNNEDVANSLAGIQQILKGLSDSGRLTAEVFNTMGQDAAEQWRIMKERGVAADQALLLMQPTLQSLYEAQKNYGFATDEATQALIDMGIANGVVGDQFQSVNQKMLDMLILIAEVLGADIPEAYRKAGEAAAAAAAPAEATQEAAQAADEAAQQAEQAAEAQRVANEAATSAANEATVSQELAEAAGRGCWGSMNDLKLKTEEYDRYLEQTEWEKPYQRAEDGIEDMSGEFVDAKGAVSDFADHAVRELERVQEAVDAVSFGHSPGGLKEIPFKTREALAAFTAMRVVAERDMGAVEGAVNAMSAAMDTRVHGMPKDDEGRWSTAPEGERGTKLEVKNEISIEITTLDPKDMDRIWREDFHPRLMSELDTNSRQTASRFEAATRRHRR